MMKYLIIALSILLSGYAEGQTCTALGAPFGWLSYIPGLTDVGVPVLGTGPNLTFVASQCPGTGEYAVVDSTTGCFSNTWLTVDGDAYGNPTGEFFLINTSLQPGVFITLTTNDEFCPGTTYQFSTHILNMDKTQGLTLPNLTFTILDSSGTVIQRYSTGNIPVSGSVYWRPYSFYFTMPANALSVTLQVANNASGGDGSAFALNDLTFREVGPAIQQTVFGFNSDSVTICQNDATALTLNATVGSCYSTAVYQWQESTDSGTTWTNIPGATALSYSRSPTGVGIYQYRLIVAQAGNIGISYCEMPSAPINVTVVPIPTPAVTITASADSICQGAAVIFTATPDSGGAVSSPLYQWMLDGVNVGFGGATYSNSTLSSSDVVSCTMTSGATCVINPVAVSNDLSVVVTAVPVTGVSITSSALSICRDSVVVFTATASNGGGDPSYQWTVNGQATGPDAPVFADSLLNNGDAINCTMTGSLLCSSPVTSPQPVMMTVYPVPAILLPADTVIAGGQSVQLDPVITGTISSYQWSPAMGLDNPAVADPVATPEGTTTYSLAVVSSDGCKASAGEIVGVFYSLLMPNAFTPNGDGHNDVFRVPPLVPVTIRQLAVYNRQGAMVFSTSNVSIGWDGTFNGHPQPAGVYIWELVYDNPLTRRTETAKGTVVLVR